MNSWRNYQLQITPQKKTEQIAAKHAYHGFFHSLISYGVLFWGGAYGSDRIFDKQKKQFALSVIWNKERYRNHFKNFKYSDSTSLYILESTTLACTCLLCTTLKKLQKETSRNHNYHTRGTLKFRTPYHRISSVQLLLTMQRLTYTIKYQKNTMLWAFTGWKNKSRKYFAKGNTTSLNNFAKTVLINLYNIV